MECAIYARVATKDQNVESQLVALREYAQRRELKVVGEFVDEGISGSVDRRPVLDQLMKDAKIAEVRFRDCVAIR